MSVARERDDAIILVPVFNDWDSLGHLLRDIDEVFRARGLSGRIKILDDGSTMLAPDAIRRQRYGNLSAIDVVRLRRNVGHQRAIAVGLAHLQHSGVTADAIVIMDGDGEDRPEDIPTLLDALRDRREFVVFAARSKRFESLRFRVMYQAYRFLHWLLTGVRVRVGNFSALTPAALARLVMDPDVWNHFPAAVFRSRIPFSSVGLPRGRRYAGVSKMRYSALVAHGLSAVAVFGEIVAARLILVFAAALVTAVGLFSAVVAIRFLTDYAIPGWATTAAGLLLVFAMQAVLSLMILVLIVLGDRSQAKVIPSRDAGMLVENVNPL